MGKKRRADSADLEAERTLYSSFVAAANSMSQLYSQAVQQQRKASVTASRQTLERLANFLRREYSGADVIPKAALLALMHQEMENLDGNEHLPHQFPVHFLPTPSPGLGGHGMDESAQPSPEPAGTHPVQHAAHANKPPSLRTAGMAVLHHHSHHGAVLLSPSSKRANSSSTATSSLAAAMDTAELGGPGADAPMLLAGGQQHGPFIAAAGDAAAASKLYVHGTGYGPC